MPGRKRGTNRSPPWSEERIKEVEKEQLKAKRRREAADTKLKSGEWLARIRKNHARSAPSSLPEPDLGESIADTDKCSLQRREHHRKRPLIGIFRRSDLVSASWTMKCLGTAQNQMHLRHKEIIYLFRRRKAYSALRDDFWRLGKDELAKVAARRVWGSVPVRLARLLAHERCPVEEVYSMWPMPFDELGNQWDEIYLREFPEVTDNNCWGTADWMSFYTSYSRDFMAAPPDRVRQIMAWKPKTKYTREIPVSGNLPADVETALRALGVDHSEIVQKQISHRRDKSLGLSTKRQASPCPSHAPTPEAWQSARAETTITATRSEATESATNIYNQRKERTICSGASLRDCVLPLAGHHTKDSFKANNLRTSKEMLFTGTPVMGAQKRAGTSHRDALIPPHPESSKQIRVTDQPRTAENGTLRSTGHRLPGAAMAEAPNHLRVAAPKDHATSAGCLHETDKLAWPIRPLPLFEFTEFFATVKGGPQSPISVPDTPTDSPTPIEVAEPQFWDASRPHYVPALTKRANRLHRVV